MKITDDSNFQNESNSPNFVTLSYGTLRRYQTYFDLKDEKGSLGKEKAELAHIVKKHFDNLEVDNEKIIENFIRIEKDQNNEKNNSLRKSIRFLEKNMAKFLDNFNTSK
jgi:hypothetical protein